jgi:hypothetical protein
VNVVKIGINAEIWDKSTHPNACGPKTKPKIIRNKTSGILNFLKINSAKNPKNRIRLIPKSTKITSTIT